MRKGGVRGELDRPDFTQANLTGLMAGVEAKAG
jgi:hypothetical protein